MLNVPLASLKLFMMCYCGYIGVLTVRGQWRDFLKYSEQEARLWTTFSGPEGGSSTHFVLFAVVYLLIISPVCSRAQRQRQQWCLGKDMPARSINSCWWWILCDKWHPEHILALSLFWLEKAVTITSTGLSQKFSRLMLQWSIPNKKKGRFPSLLLKSPL